MRMISRAERNALDWQNKIREQMEALAIAERGDSQSEDASYTDLMQEMTDTAISCMVHTDFYTILLATGGPALRVTGELDERRVPKTASLEHQDWMTPWCPFTSSEEEPSLLLFARLFDFRA